MKLNKAFKTGHQHIDHHHEELFKLVSMLDKAIQSHDEETLNHIIEFLETYVQDHFKEEEELMKTHLYKGYKQHKQEHEKFKELVKDLRESYDTNKPPTHIIFDIRKLIDNLVFHIQTVDIGIAKLEKST